MNHANDAMEYTFGALRRSSNRTALSRMRLDLRGMVDFAMTLSTGTVILMNRRRSDSVSLEGWENEGGAAVDRD